MSNKPEPSSGALQQQQRKRRGLIPPELVDLVVTPVQVGAWSGALSVSQHGLTLSSNIYKVLSE